MLIELYYYIQCKHLMFILERISLQHLRFFMDFYLQLLNSRLNLDSWHPLRFHLVKSDRRMLSSSSPYWMLSMVLLFHTFLGKHFINVFKLFWLLMIIVPLHTDSFRSSSKATCNKHPLFMLYYSVKQWGTWNPNSVLCTKGKVN